MLNIITIILFQVMFYTLFYIFWVKFIISDKMLEGWAMNLITLRKLVHRVYGCEYFMAKCFIYQYIFDTQQGDGSEPTFNFTSGCGSSSILHFHT